MNLRPMSDYEEAWTENVLFKVRWPDGLIGFVTVGPGCDRVSLDELSGEPVGWVPLAGDREVLAVEPRRFVQLAVGTAGHPENGLYSTVFALDSAGIVWEWGGLTWSRLAQLPEEATP